MTTLVDRREKAEKGFSSLRTPADRFAYWLSQISSPFVVGLAVFGYVALSTASTMTEGFEWLTVIGVGLLVPFGSIWRGVKSGKWTDLHVSRRSERLVPLLVGLIALGGMLAGLLLLSASRQLVATGVSIIISFALATLITQAAKYKISLHIDSTYRNMLIEEFASINEVRRCIFWICPLTKNLPLLFEWLCESGSNPPDKTIEQHAKMVLTVARRAVRDGLPHSFTEYALTDLHPPTCSKGCETAFSAYPGCTFSSTVRGKQQQRRYL